MKNMKKILSALTALSFVPIAGAATIACNSCASKPTAMDAKVLSDLGVYTADGKSDLSTKLAADPEKSYIWTTEKLNGINAAKLLGTSSGGGTNGTNGSSDGGAETSASASEAPKVAAAESGDGLPALSEASYNFLTKVLGLSSIGEGAWSDKKFSTEEAAKISLHVDSVTPVLEAKQDKKDLVVTGGYATIQWKKGDGSAATNVGGNYSVDLKADKETGVILEVLPTLALTDFDTTKAPLSNFTAGKPKSGVKEGADITTLLKKDAENSKKLQQVIDLSGGLKSKITVTKITAAEDNFKDGDSLTIKVTLGPVQFDKEMQLTLGATSGGGDSTGGSSAETSAS